MGERPNKKNIESLNLTQNENLLRKSIGSLNVRQLVISYPFSQQKGRRKGELVSKTCFKPFFQDPIDFI